MKNKYITNLRIDGLFNERNIDIDFKKTTVIVGKNGLGKSTILKLIRALLNNDKDCNELNFCSKIKLTFSDGSIIESENYHKSINEITKKIISKILKEQITKHLNSIDSKLDINFDESLKLSVNNELKKQISLDTNFNLKSLRKSEINKITMKKETENYLSNECVVSYISTINMSANSFNEIVLSDGVEKNILNWELESELENLSENENVVQRRKFISVINELFSDSNKKIKTIINKRTQKRRFSVYDINGNVIDINYLSSGERQVIYILSKVANASDKFTYFLMDEPEISLHLAWQENLINNIKKINNNCQVIIVTHSPAIVMNGYMDSFVDMKDIYGDM
ncbi:AAA family ATPase [Providencia stuartii]|uniref:AAA family ATPase n=1 Tax=Providencia stuartii TaxID=588 RepID=UPI001B744216|nr:AAA family ATPase [Providencia stuartii]MBQ0695843.1 ATP-binding protein [Providencia stuartii]